MWEDYIRWKRVKEEVGKIVKTLQGETGTRFEHLDELEQECLTHVYEKLPRFMGKNGCKEFSFIYQLCRNHLINYHIFHTRGKRDYRQKVNAGLHPVNFIGHYAEEDSDEVHYIGLDSDSPEDILQAEQLCQAMVEKHQSEKHFRKFLDTAYHSHNTISLSTNTAKFALDNILEEV